MAKLESPRPDRPTQHHHASSSSLWANQNEMKRYISKLKSELAEQKSRVKLAHRNKTEEIKRLQESLTNEKQRAVENVSKKFESDKAYELKKMRESVVKQKDHEFRQAVRLKDEELRALKLELQESRNNTKILEDEYKRISYEKSRNDGNENEKRWKSEISNLRNDNRRLEDNLRIRTESDNEKAELIRQMKDEHESEMKRVTRESKQSSLKDLRQLKAVSRDIELKNQQLAAKEENLRRLQQEKNDLGKKLLERSHNGMNNNTLDSQKMKGLAISKMSEANLDPATREKIRQLKLRNSELVAIASKLEEKVKQIQEEKKKLEKSKEVNNPSINNLKKAFARQRAKDLAEHASLVMNKDKEIKTLKQKTENIFQKGIIENGFHEDMEKIINQNIKECLLFERQVSLKTEHFLGEIKQLNAKNKRLSDDNDVLKDLVSKLSEVECEHEKLSEEVELLLQRKEKLEETCLEKDDLIKKLEREKEMLVNQMGELQTRNAELMKKIDRLNELDRECINLKVCVKKLESNNCLLNDKNTELRNEIKRLEKMHFFDKDSEDGRLQEITCCSSSPSDGGFIQNDVLNSTPKENKSTQTSQLSSPDVSPILHIKNNEEDIPRDEDETPVLLNGHCCETSSSTSFDVDNVGFRIRELAVCDSDEISCNRVDSGQDESALSEMNENLAQSSDEEALNSAMSSYSADVSQIASENGSEIRNEERVHEGDDVVQVGDDGVQEDDGRIQEGDGRIQEGDGRIQEGDGRIQEGDGSIQEGDDLDDDHTHDYCVGDYAFDLLEVENRLSIFKAKYSYDPVLYSPNENPELELAFQAGDYVYVFGDIDEDGFYIGELMNGKRGLVPSNFIERIIEDEAFLEKYDDNNDGSEERRHQKFRSSLDHVLDDKLADIHESDEDDFDACCDSEDRTASSKAEADQGFDSVDSECNESRVPSPTKLSLDEQFTNSALISWRGVQMANEDILGYNIYVDGQLTTRTKGNQKTNAVIENIDPTQTYRLSVRTRAVTGTESPDSQATMIFGPEATYSPSNVCITKLTATSGLVQWTPAHSNYQHEISLNDMLLVCVRPSCSFFTLKDLIPSTLYTLQVKTVLPDSVKLSLGKNIEENICKSIEFTTADGGLPEPPVDLQIGQLTSSSISLMWLPVTLSEDGCSNGYRVSGYKLYVSGIYCAETVSACLGHLVIPLETLQNLGKRLDMSRMRFVLRTLSVMGESTDSNIVELDWNNVRDTIDRNITPDVKEPSLDREGVIVAMKSNVIHAPLKLDNASVADVNSFYEESTDCILRNSSEKKINHVNGEDKPSMFSNSGNTVPNQTETVQLRVDCSVEVSKYNGLRCSDEDLSKLGRDTKQSKDQDCENNVTATLTTLDEQKNVTLSPKVLVRKPPIVTQYENAETESESCSTETKTEDTEDELIERFEQLQLQEFSDGMYMKMDSNPTTNQHSLRIENLQNKALDKDMEVNNGEPCLKTEVLNNEEMSKIDGEQPKIDVNFSNNTLETSNLKCGAIFCGESETLDLNLSNNKEKVCIDQLQDTNSLSEHELSPISDSESSRSDNGSDINEESMQTKNFQTLMDSAMLKIKNMPAYSFDTGTSHTESETENGPLLSVIHEVDEDNLTDKAPSKHISENMSQKNLPHSSDVSGKNLSRSISSDDEGFRTEDDVLDLLHDELDDVCENINEVADKENRSPKINDGELSLHEVDNNKKNDPIGVQNDLPNGSKMTNNHTNMSLKKNIASSVDGNLESDIEMTDNASSNNLSESTYSSDFSKSDSSISQDPPSADLAIQTIMNSLSLPSNGKMTSHKISESVSGVSLESSQFDYEQKQNSFEEVRYFIALYSYDPLLQSPNDNGADEELPFNKGDVIKVFGEKDMDGFYWGECKKLKGYVPSNMIVETKVNEAMNLFNQPNGDFMLNNEFILHETVSSELHVDGVSENPGPERVIANHERLGENIDFETLRSREMKALYDYDPHRDSPNVDSEIELCFKAGDIINIFGEMDVDGFFKGELNGVRGLAPSNFLEPVNNNTQNSLFIDDTELPDNRSSSFDREFVQSSPSTLKSDEFKTQAKKKKNLFTKGKKIFKKAFK